MWECKICRRFLEDNEVECWSCKGKRNEVELMDSFRKIEAENIEKNRMKLEKSHTYRRIATASWIMPILAVVWIDLHSRVYANISPSIVLFRFGITLCFLIGGITCGIISIKKNKEYGSKGILKPSVTGLIISGLFLVLSGASFINGFFDNTKEVSVVRESAKKFESLSESLNQETSPNLNKEEFQELKELYLKRNNIYIRILSTSKCIEYIQIAEKVDNGQELSENEIAKAKKIVQYILDQVSSEDRKIIDRLNQLVQKHLNIQKHND